jgi:hypothetical protein
MKNLLRIIMGCFLIIPMGMQSTNVRSDSFVLPHGAIESLAGTAARTLDDGTQMMSPMESGVANTMKSAPSRASGDSVSITATLVFNDTLKYNGKVVITPGNIYVYNKDFWAMKYYSTANKVTTFTFKVPKGKYDMLCYFTILLGARDKYNGCSQIVVVKENLNVQNDTAINMNIEDAKNHIHVAKLLPNGKEFNWGTCTKTATSTTYSADKNIDSQSYYTFFIKKGIDRFIFARWIQNMGGKTINADGSVSDLTNMMDFYVSDLSSDYQLYTTFIAYGAYEGVTGPYIVGVSKFGASKNDTVSNSASDYVIHDEYFKTSVEGKSAKLHLPGYHFMAVSSGYPIIGARAYTNENIADGGPVRIFSCLPKVVKNGNQLSMILNSVYGDYCYYKTSTSIVIKYNSGPRYIVDDSLKVKYINNGIDGSNIQKDSITGIKVMTPQEAFSFMENKDDKIMVNNNCPITVTDAENYYNSTGGYKYFALHPYFIGRYGEMNNVDYDSLKISVKYNGTEEFSGAYTALNAFFTSWAKAKHTDGVINVSFSNSNVYVDSLVAKNVVTSTFDETKSDWTPPTIQMLQFRNKNGVVTDRFKSDEDGVVAITAGDFQFNDDNNYYNCKPVVLKVEYSPYGADKWAAIAITEDASKYQFPSFGYYYSGAITNVTGANSDGWYDMRITVSDNAGNVQTQVVSPAFNKAVPTSVSTVNAASSQRAYVRGNDLVIVNGNGVAVSVYSITGQQVLSVSDASNPINVEGLQQGIYLVRMMKSGKSTVNKVVIR